MERPIMGANASVAPLRGVRLFAGNAGSVMGVFLVGRWSGVLLLTRPPKGTIGSCRPCGHARADHLTERLGDIVANAVTLVLADHHVLVAEGLGMLLDAEDDLVVLDLAHHSGQAVESAAAHRPAVLVLDAQLPTGDLAETLAAAKAASPTTKLLVLSGDAHPETTTAVLTSGADRCLAKDRSSRQVASALRQLAAGQQAVIGAAEPRPGRDPSVELRVRTLTSRERELLGLLAIGWSNRRIAEATHLSYLTVRSHMQNLLLKLGVHSQLEAVAFAVEHGIVEMRGTLVWERHSA